MKTITTLLTTLFLAACNTAPAIIPDTTSDNVIMKKLDYDIQHGDKVSTGWGWILWYLPIVALLMAWAWRKYIKECPECGKSESNNPNT